MTTSFSLSIEGVCRGVSSGDTSMMELEEEGLDGGGDPRTVLEDEGLEGTVLSEDVDS